MGDRKVAAHGGLFGSREYQWKGGDMFKKKKTSGYGSAADELLGYTKPTNAHKELDKKQHAQTKTDFNEEWVRRSTYEYDVAQARSGARWELSTYLILLVIIPLIGLVIVFHNQRDERIQCGKLANSTIEYMNSVGEILPPSCY